MSDLWTNCSFQSYLFNESAGTIKKKHLNDSVTNWTDSVLEFTEHTDSMMQWLLEQKNQWIMAYIPVFLKRKVASENLEYRVIWTTFMILWCWAVFSPFNSHCPSLSSYWKKVTRMFYTNSSWRSKQWQFSFFEETISLIKLNCQEEFVSSKMSSSWQPIQVSDADSSTTRELKNDVSQSSGHWKA